ncbi:LysR family transcriptional regulator ArgP [Pollutimonas sp. H1-120]|uniref:LysR family transcriptional regulator ArgP n=1 Tax=Pollutimonas sp. H1-120 TaxID=3148824 RepID=UPI003B52037D
MKIDHGNLRALAAVVREGSFERAAASLSVTPSAISQRIKALEERMGRLLVQRGVPAEATPDGRVLVQLAEQTALLEHDALGRLGLDDAATAASIAVAVNHDSLETWFMRAAELFAAGTRATLDLQSEDQDHTAALLRNGAVLGAVTTLADPVQGCRIHALGSMRYIATCSPQFHERYFAQGVNARTLAAAPVLVFNRKDAMQARFARRVMGGASWQPPVWWLPSSRAFVHATLGGLGWTMNPLPLVQRELDEGRLVPLRTRATEDVPLYWQHWRVHSQAMDVLTDSILEAAGGLVKKGGKHA